MTSASPPPVRESATTQRDRSFENTLIGPIVLDWIDWLEVGGLADGTLDQYERDLSRLCKRYPDKALADVTDLDLLQVIRSFPKPSRRVRTAAFRAFFKWAIRRRLIEKNPCDLLPDMKRTKQRYIDTFTEAEVDDLTSLPGDDGVLMLVLLETGLRKAEARGLQVRRIKLSQALTEGEWPSPAGPSGLVKAGKTDAKSTAKIGTSSSPSVSALGELVVVGGKGDKDRVVPMTNRLVAALQGWLMLTPRDPQDYLWYARPGGGRVQRQRQIGDGSFDRWWRRCLQDAGVRYRHPHVARHTFATRWLRRGGRLETLSIAMGHASIQTTADLYAHLDTRDMAEDIKVIQKAGK